MFPSPCSNQNSKVADNEFYDEQETNANAGIDEEVGDIESNSEQNKNFEDSTGTESTTTKTEPTISLKRLSNSIHSIGRIRVSMSPDEESSRSIVRLSLEPRMNQPDEEKQRSRDFIIGKEESSSELLRFYRSDLHDLFLKRAGVLLSDDILDQIFKKADRDGDGSVSVDDVVVYINTIRKKTPQERFRIIMFRVAKSVTTLFALSFLLGGVAYMAVNMLSRAGRALHGQKHYYGQIGGWLYQIGCFGFIYLVCIDEKLAFEREQLTHQKLAAWIRWDLPVLFVEETKQHGVSIPGEQSSRKERISIGKFLEQNADSRSNFETNPEILTLKQLRLVLESQGLFLSYDELTSLVKEIENKDETEILMLHCLVDFAYKSTKKKTITAKQKALTVMRRCFKNVGFWTSTSYVIGTIPFIVVDLVEGPPVLIKHLYGLGCSLFFVGAAGGLLNVYHMLSQDLSSMDRMDAKLRGVAVKIGMLVTFFDRKLIRRSTVNSVNDDHISWLSSLDMARFQEEGARHLFELAGNKTEIRVTELYDFFFDLGTLKEVDRDAGRMKVSNQLQCYVSLYSGFYLSVEDCKKLFKKIGPTTTDGTTLRCSQIGDYIINLDPDCMNAAERRHRVWMSLPTSFSFWLVIEQICAASCQLLATYIPTDSDRMTRNLYFAGSVLWSISTLYFVLGAYRVKAAKFDQVQESKSLLKAGIARASREEEGQRQAFEDDTLPIIASQVFRDTPQKREFVSLNGAGRSTSTRSILSALREKSERHIAAVHSED